MYSCLAVRPFANLAKLTPVLITACRTQLSLIISGVSGQKPIKFIQDVRGSSPMLMCQLALPCPIHFEMPAWQIKVDFAKYTGTQMSLITSGVTRSKFTKFLPRDAMLSAVYAVVVCLSVCLSVCVCLSVTLRYCIKTAKRRITQITPHDSPVTLVFWHHTSRRTSNGITPYGGDKCRWGGLKFVTFDEKCAITRKRYKIDAQFLLKSYRKSYVLYQMAMFPMTVGDS